MDRSKSLFAWDFVPEWCALALLVLVDLLWSARVNLTFTAGWRDFLVMGLAVAIAGALRLFAMRRGGLMAEYFALSMATSTGICALSYLCLASSTALVDARLMAMDRLLGFDWLAGYRFVQSHPLLTTVLGLAYGSLIYQGIYCGILMGLMNNRRRLREMFWVFFCCGLMACAGSLLVPAFGPSKLWNVETDTGFVPVMEHILSGRDLTFPLSGMVGLVQFPSFHTSMALAYAWVFRKTGVIAIAICALNVVMLCAVPFFGGHYLVDMIGGTAAMLLSLGLVKAMPVAWARLRSSGVVMPTPAKAEN